MKEECLIAILSWGVSFIGPRTRQATNISDLSDSEMAELRKYWKENWKQITKNFKKKYQYDESVQPFAFYYFDLETEDADEAFELFSKARSESERQRQQQASEKWLNEHRHEIAFYKTEKNKQ